MTRVSLALVLAVGTLCGCPSTTSPPSHDASTVDASAVDASAVDAATSADAGTDAVASDDVGTDAATGLDAATDADAGIDCATIGCGAPPICGEACGAPCGCCPCAEGSEMGTYVCQGGCWAPRGSGVVGDACTMTSDCGAGLSCCYPCGIPGCTNQCTPTCAAGDPGCVGGCLLRA